jgi:hypothetical protein
MNLLQSYAIGAAVTGQTPGPVVKFNAQPRALTIQANFVYGAGGTTATAYVQTSHDGGANWTDIAALQFTTAGGRKTVNLTSRTPVTTPVVPSDGSMTANTCQDGILGPMYRVKVTTTGTYTGTTTLSVDIASDQATFPNA